MSWQINSSQFGAKYGYAEPFTSCVLIALPQAFMHIEWMENYFRNLTANVWANYNNNNNNIQFLETHNTIKNSLYACEKSKYQTEIMIFQN